MGVIIRIVCRDENSCGVNACRLYLKSTTHPLYHSPQRDKGANTSAARVQIQWWSQGRTWLRQIRIDHSSNGRRMGTRQCRLEHCHPCSGRREFQWEKCRVDPGKEGIEGTLLDGGRTYFDYGIVLTTIISTKGALRLLTTYDNHPSNPSHPIRPSPHIALTTTSHDWLIWVDLHWPIKDDRKTKRQKDRKIKIQNDKRQKD